MWEMRQSCGACVEDIILRVWRLPSTTRRTWCGPCPWDPDVLLSPDIFVVPLEQVRTLDWSLTLDPLLVAEILSPSSARHDRFTKRRRYLEAGVPLYWIVDPDEHRVEVWKPTDSFPTLERERLVWQPAEANEPFTMRPEELFRPV